jgi:hypothetical protein
MFPGKFNDIYCTVYMEYFIEPLALPPPPPKKSTVILYCTDYMHTAQFFISNNILPIQLSHNPVYSNNDP